MYVFYMKMSYIINFQFFLYINTLVLVLVMFLVKVVRGFKNVQGRRVRVSEFCERNVKIEKVLQYIYFSMVYIGTSYRRKGTETRQL